MQLRSLLTLLLIGCATSLAAQSPVEWDDLIEQIAEDDATTAEMLMEDLADGAFDPVNLNVATREQLEIIPFLSDRQIESILAYVYFVGEMQTPHELLLVEALDKATVERLLPYVCVAPAPKPRTAALSWKDLARRGRHEIIARFDVPFYVRDGYRKGAYSGTPQYHSLRYNFSVGETLTLGITAEKDAGEPFGTLHNRRGYDFYSPYVVFRGRGALKTLAVGNYRVSLGRGLTVGHNFMMGKATAISLLHRRVNTIRKHASTDEYNYFSGAAATVEWANFTLTGFYSHRRIDAIGTSYTITSLQKSGLHRTHAEIERRANATLQAMGGNVGYRTPQGTSVGLNFLYYFFDRPYAPAVRPYSLYNLRGNAFHNLSIDYRHRLHGFELTGETAVGKYGVATLNMLSYRFADNSELMFVQRYYSRDYWALFARAFSKGGYVQNESGYYLAAEWHPLARVKLFFAADLFSFPWLKYLIDKPSQGVELTAQTTYTPSKRWTLDARYQYEQKEKNYTASKSKAPRPTYKHRARCRLSYTPHQKLVVRTTLDYVGTHSQHAIPYQGFQVAQAVAWSVPATPLQIEAQGSYFLTDGYDARISSFERSLPYAYNSLSHYGRGIRSWVFVRCDVRRSLSLFLKYGHTQYFDREAIGSGNDRIPQARKQDLQILLRWKI
jgi:hypothetical protein